MKARAIHAENDNPFEKHSFIEDKSPGSEKRISIIHK